MQAFATELVGRFNIEDADEDPAHVVARIRAVLEIAGSGLGATEGELLEAMLNYWGAVTDITQRQVMVPSAKASHSCGKTRAEWCSRPPSSSTSLTAAWRELPKPRCDCPAV